MKQGKTLSEGDALQIVRQIEEYISEGKAITIWPIDDDGGDWRMYRVTVDDCEGNTLAECEATSLIDAIFEAVDYTAA